MSREILTLGYTRLSNDPGMMRADHTTQNRALDTIESHYGLPARHAFTDDDLSASKAGVERAGYLALIAAIEAVDPARTQPVVILWALDRFTRRIDDALRLADLIERKRGRIITSAQGELTVEAGRRDSFLLSSTIGHIEAEKIGFRTRGGMETQALGGRAHSRMAMAYGWRSTAEILPGGKIKRTMHIDPDAQAVVREAAERIAHGDSLRGIARDFQERGIQTPGAAMGVRTKLGEPPIDIWTSTKLRALVVRPANVGIRVHRAGRTGEVSRSQAAWPALLTQEEYDAAMAVLTAPDRPAPQAHGVRYLLSGLIRCERCGMMMRAQSGRQGTAKGKPRVFSSTYRCQLGCTTRNMARVDTMLTLAVIRTLKDPAIRATLLADDSDDIARARESKVTAEAMQRSLEADYGDRLITREQFLRMNAAEAKRIADADAVLSSRRGIPAYDDLLRVSPGMVEEAWHATSFDRQRAIIGAFFDITALDLKGQHRPPRFDPTTVRITLRRSELAQTA